jgi:hypothetical protein
MKTFQQPLCVVTVPLLAFRLIVNRTASGMAMERPRALMFRNGGDEVLFIRDARDLTRIHPLLDHCITFIN